MADFKSRIRELRIKNKLSGAELGTKVGVTRYAISKWETGESTAPQDMVLKLADYFNVSADYLLGRTDDPRPFPPEDTRTIEERWEDPNNEFLYAMYGEIKDLTDEQKEELLNFVDYLKSKANKKNN